MGEDTYTILCKQGIGTPFLPKLIYLFGHSTTIGAASTDLFFLNLFFSLELLPYSKNKRKHQQENYSLISYLLFG